jgi:glycosyltransferase involved in cell wall biosynthesis
LTEEFNIPKVSVVVPIYNARPTLSECLTSVFNSSYRNFEVIVVDDASTDYCLDIYGKFPCKVIRTAQRSGPGKARNIGVLNSSGSILLFLDSDCIVEKDWMKKMVESLSGDSTAAVGGGYSFIAGTGKTRIERLAFWELKFRRKTMSRFMESLPSCNLACRKDAFLAAGGFPTHLRYPASEDLEFSYNLSRKYKLLWNKDNGVGHHFRNTIRGYLKQQFNFAKPLVSLYIRKPLLVVANTHHRKNGFISLSFFVFFITGLLLSLFELKWIFLSLASMFITPLNELGFLIFLAKQEGLRFALSSTAILYFRDATWSCAALNGLVIFVYKILFFKSRIKNEDIISSTAI